MWVSFKVAETRKATSVDLLGHILHRVVWDRKLCSTHRGCPASSSKEQKLNRGCRVQYCPWRTSNSRKVLFSLLAKSHSPALWRNCFLQVQALMYFTEDLRSEAKQLTPGQHDAPHSGSPIRLTNTPISYQCHFFLLQEANASHSLSTICISM